MGAWEDSGDTGSNSDSPLFFLPRPGSKISEPSDFSTSVGTASQAGRRKDNRSGFLFIFFGLGSDFASDGSPLSRRGNQSEIFTFFLLGGRDGVESVMREDFVGFPFLLDPSIDPEPSTKDTNRSFLGEKGRKGQWGGGWGVIGGGFLIF